ncbi:hypothetical protein GH741_08255 [Aquibacillus halophilus]|uniref:Four-carbon acid sugar kinase family protein n=1 Tax=Aquibacillus halophilus TaxID=930132 RepID=A0A6A8DIC7_9BACI|nr:four-carbon acid sugar kinase family protein [Aquibacillus halophilus]MRH42677.1 hypothetical protein [Aquibacillus halophilus]
MERLIGLIADDLTGASDSGVKLTEKGIDTSVLFEIPTTHRSLTGGFVIDTNSRALTKNEAFSITKQAAEFLKQAGYIHIYKKMDSTLRGHIEAELEALRIVFKPDFIIIAPAFPSYGRTTRNGIHYVNDVKISETEFSKDPTHQVQESYIPSIIEKGTGQKVGLINTKELGDLQKNWQAKLKEYKDEGIQYLVCDVDFQEELSWIAKHISQFSSSIIWAGSAGLAEVIPEILGFNKNEGKRAFPTSKIVMTVSGSLSEMTQQQVNYAITQPNVAGVEVQTDRIFGENWNFDKSYYIGQCLSKLREGKHVILHLQSNSEVRDQVNSLADNLGLNAYQVGQKISRAISELVLEVVRQCPDLKAFVLTGGDTAKGISKALGAIGLRIIKEIEAGIPIGRLIGPEKDIYVATKAGAFGERESIYRVMEELKGGSEHE